MFCSTKREYRRDALKDNERKNVHARKETGALPQSPVRPVWTNHSPGAPNLPPFPARNASILSLHYLVDISRAAVL